MIIPGFQIEKARYESSKSLIYRGRRDADQAPVILKRLKPDYPSPEAIALFCNEYEITHSLCSAGVKHLEGRRDSP
jgi:serine/threonine protein kinase